MDQTATATPPAVQWYNLGPSRSAKRSLFSFGRRRPDPIVYPETSPEQLADDPNWQRHDWGRSGSQFNRSMSMHVRSSRNGRKSCNSSSENSSQQTHTGPRTKAVGWKLLGPFRQSAAPEFEFKALSRTVSTVHRPTEQEGNTANAACGEVNASVLYGTPTRRPRHRPTKSAPACSDADRPSKPERVSWRPNATDAGLPATSSSTTSPTSAAARDSVDDQKRLEMTLRDRERELRELRQTMEMNEKALLRSLDDERHRWAAERHQLEAELLSARRHSIPVPGSVFHTPSTDHDPPVNRVQTAAVVVVGPIQRPPSSTLNSVDVGPQKFESSFASSRSTEIPLPGVIGSNGNVYSNTSKNDFEKDRQSPGEEVGVDGDVAEKLRLELELCRQEFADERRRWTDEKRVVVEYQLRLQTYCRQLTDRNQLLEEQLKTMSLELGRNGGSSGYSSDSAALIVQFLDDSNLLTSSL